jgi:hypothetical protein
MRKASGFIVVLSLLAGLAAHSGQSAPARTVPCDESIGNPAFPYIGGKPLQYRYRLVLGEISVPPAYLKQVVPTNEQPWSYWRKAGLIVRGSGKSVTISVPEAWRTRARISWGNGGNGGNGGSETLRIAGCGSDPRSGNAYAGGFYLSSSSACVPLIFRVGQRSATVRFGIGQVCPAMH